MKISNRKELVELGTFNTKGTLIISDPGYAPGVWCREELNVPPGKYTAFIEKSDEDDWGIRVSNLIIIRDYNKDESTESEFISNLQAMIDAAEEEFGIGVDSGQAGFFDSSLKIGESDEIFDELCNITLSSALAGVYKDLGVVTSTGFGDGVYPVRSYSLDGVLKMLYIEFIDEE